MQRGLVRRIIPSQRHLLAARLALALGAPQYLQFACLAAGTALVHMDVAVQLLVLAAPWAVAMQQPLHTELSVTLAVVVQCLATELQRCGQLRF